MHAGTYWTTLSVSGADSQNFKFVGFDGYSDANYFVNNDGDYYLVWKGSNEKAIENSLPELSNLQTAVKFEVARSMQGSVLAPTSATLPYMGEYYYPGENGLPYVLQGTTSNIEVTVGATIYSYDEYVSNSIIKNAGTYEITIYDKSAVSDANDVISCDLFNADAELEHNVSLTITKAKVTVTSTSTPEWTKVYDKNNGYTAYSYDKDIDYVANSDGIIKNTNASVSAVFDGANVDVNRVLVFTISGADANNYFLAFNDLTLDVDYTVRGNEYVINAGTASITPKIITVAGETNKVYDGTTALANFEITSMDIEDGDVVEVTGEYADANVGTHAITLTSSNSNYAISSEISATGTISHKPLTVAWTNNGASVIYDGQSHGVSVTVSGMVAGKEEGIDVTGMVERGLSTTLTDSFYATNAGSYSITIALSEGDSNYTLNGAVTTASWIIERKELVIEWQRDAKGSESDDDYVYDFVEYSVVYSNVERSVTPIVSGIILGDDLTYTVSGSSATNAGTYVSTVSALAGEDKDNYKLPAVNAIEWSIEKANIIGVAMSDLNATYNAQKHSISVSTTNSQHGLPLNVTYQIVGETTGEEQVNIATNGAINAGEYVVTATFAESANYNALVLNAELVINKAQIEGVIFENATYDYDGAVKSIALSGTTTLYGDAIEVGYTLSGTTAGGSEVSLNANGIASAGVYTIVASLDAGDNYVTTTKSAKLTINARAISIEWTKFIENSGIYNGVAQGVKLTVGNVVDGDSVSISLVKTFNGETETITINSAGEYTYSAVNASTSGYYLEITGISGESKDNYTLPTNLSSRFDIEKRPVQIVSWSDGVNVYANAEEIVFEYAKKEYVLTANVEGILALDAENVEIILVGNSGTNAKNYTITATLTANDNYEMSPVNKEWRIDAKVVTIVWTNNTIKTYNKQEQFVTAEVEGIIEGDVATLEYVDNSAINVGNYTAKAVGVDNANYVLDTNAPTLGWEIDPATITGITLEELEVTYDGNEYGLSLNSNLTQYGDSISVTMVTKDARDNVIASNKTKHAGEYNVTATLDAGANYVSSSLSATLNVKQRALTFVWSQKTAFTYNKTAQGVTLSVSGIVAGDTVVIWIRKKRTRVRTLPLSLIIGLFIPNENSS